MRRRRGKATCPYFSELGGVWGVAVDLLRVEHLFGVGELESRGVPAERNAAVEARAVTHVAARAAGHVHLEPHGVLVVVDHELFHGLHEAARRALVPERLAAAAPVMRLTG